MELDEILGMGIEEGAANAIFAAFEAIEGRISVRERALETRSFLINEPFVNEATRSYYGAKIDEVLAEHPDADRGKVLSALTRGEDGELIPNIFLKKPQVLNLPPAGSADKNEKKGFDLNGHRIVR